jgi:hypothetical protein
MAEKLDRVMLLLFEYLETEVGVCLPPHLHRASTKEQRPTAR